jgi:hypothetical protein
MEVTFTDKYSRAYQFRSLAECAEYMLRGDSSNDGMGTVETIEDRAEHNSRAIGRLMAVLAKKNILNEQECIDLLQNFDYNDKE